MVLAAICSRLVCGLTGVARGTCTRGRVGSLQYTRRPAPDCTLANYLAELFPTRNYSDYSAPLHVIGFPGTESRTTDVRSPTTGHEICRSNIYSAIVRDCSRHCGTAGRPHRCGFAQKRRSLFQHLCLNLFTENR